MKQVHNEKHPKFEERRSKEETVGVSAVSEQADTRPHYLDYVNRFENTWHQHLREKFQ